MAAEESGQPSVGNLDKPQHLCSYCGVRERFTKFSIFSDYEAVYYCSKNCQKRHWSEHKVLCHAISELSRRVSKDIKKLGGIKQCLLPIDDDGSSRGLTDEDSTAAVATEGKKLADILGAVGFGSEKSAFHKDFKIRGLIGEPGQKDKLSYVSLLKQIEEGIDRGYSDKEIVQF